jgi:hypothetical protein
MTPETQTILTVTVPTLAVLIGILVNNSRLNDLNSRLTEMTVNLKETWRSELRRVEEVLDARLSHLEERMTSLEERLR